jgi:hypothetical protein
MSTKFFASVETVKVSFVAHQRGEINWAEFCRRADLTNDQAAAMKRISSCTPAAQLNRLICQILAA